MIGKNHLDINDKKPTIIYAKPHLNYEFIDSEIMASPNHIITKRGGNDLGILFNNEVKDAGILIIKDFYKYSDNALIGKAENNYYYHYVPDTGEVSDYVSQLATKQASGQALGSTGLKQPWWTDGSNSKPHKGFKSLFKSIIPEKIFATETSTPENVEQPATGRGGQVYNVKTNTFTKVDSIEENSFFDNVEIAPLILGGAMAVGTIALFANGGDKDKEDNSTQNEQDFVTKGNEKNNDLSGTDNNDTLDGLAGDDKLDGKAGNDILIGGKGSDTLTGGKGSDTFTFKLSDLTDKQDIDKITDFTPKIDKIQLPKELFKADKVTDNLTDYIKYDKATGELSYDSDGKGGTDAVVFATLTNHVDLTVDSDTFQII